MAIAKKPITTTNKFSVQNQAIIDNIIAKGGEVASVKTSPVSNNKNIKPIKLLIPAGLLNEVDELLISLPIKRTRINWILEAIYEKLQREQSGKEAANQLISN
jgi:hypothetical protein